MEEERCVALISQNFQKDTVFHGILVNYTASVTS